VILGWQLAYWRPQLVGGWVTGHPATANNDIPSWKAGSAAGHMPSTASLDCLTRGSRGALMTLDDAFTNVTPRFGFDLWGGITATSLMSSSAAATADSTRSEAESGRPGGACLGWHCSVVFSKLISCFISLLLLPTHAHKHTHTHCCLNCWICQNPQRNREQKRKYFASTTYDVNDAAHTAVGLSPLLVPPPGTLSAIWMPLKRAR